ncbi:MAG: sugar phosphate isomerase/epimerase family protein [Bryobacteraceae bacterium]
MQHALSTKLLLNHRLTTVWLDRIWDAEIPLVELYCARQHLDYRNKAQINELGYWFRDSQLKVHSVHSPIFSDIYSGRSGPDAIVTITERVKSKRLPMVDEIKRTLEIAESFPFRYLVQHLGVPGEEFDEFKVDAAFSALEELMLFARHRGVEILLENIPNGLSSAERLLTFLNLTHLNLNVCFDIGHAHMNEGVEEAYKLLKPRIRSTHLHDNNGTDDLHLFPLKNEGGTIDWKAAMKLLRSAPNQYPLLLEPHSVEDVAEPVRLAQSILEQLEGLSDDSPR